MFAPGDVHILHALFTYMYLQTGMLVKILNRHRGSILRRLRWLTSNGFVVSLERPMLDNTYALGMRGWEFIAESFGTTPENLPFSRRAKRIEGMFLQHALQTIRFWIELELAVKQHSSVALYRAIPEWTLDESTSNDVNKRFLLRESLEDPKSENEKRYSFQPDAAFLLYNRAMGAKRLAAMFLEVDRCTEAHRVLRKKFMGFKLAFEQGIYRKYDAALMRVLFVIDGGEKRIQNMQHHLQLFAEKLADSNPADPTKELPSPASFVHLFRFAQLKDINHETLVDSPIWWGWRGNTKYSLFNPSQRMQEKSNV